MNTTITLRQAQIGVRDFDIAHAERVLSLNQIITNPAEHWEIADKKFVFTNGKIIQRSGNRGPNKPEEQGTDSEGGEA